MPQGRIRAGSLLDSSSRDFTLTPSGEDAIFLVCFHLGLSKHLMTWMSWMSARIRKLNIPKRCWVRLGKATFGPSRSRKEVNLERKQLLILTVNGNCTVLNWPALNLKVLHGVFLLAPYPLYAWERTETKELRRQRNYVTYFIFLMI